MIERFSRAQKTPAGTFRLVDYLAPNRVAIPLRGAAKEELIRELVRVAARSARLEMEAEDVFRAVWQRESVLSTGIGDAVAIPHAKYDGVDDVGVVAGVSERPVDFDALDGKPVQLFFLIVGPRTASSDQVRLLSRIGRLARHKRLRRRLVSATDPESFLRTLGAAESRA